MAPQIIDDSCEKKDKKNLISNAFRRSASQ